MKEGRRRRRHCHNPPPEPPIPPLPPSLQKKFNDSTTRLFRACIAILKNALADDILKEHRQQRSIESQLHSNIPQKFSNVTDIVKHPGKMAAVKSFRFPLKAKSGEARNAFKASFLLYLTIVVIFSCD